MAKKQTFPRTWSGFQKKIDEVYKDKILKGDRSYETLRHYVLLNLKQCQHELDTVKNSDSKNPIVKGLVPKYERLVERWQARLDYVDKNFSNAIV